MIKWFVINGVKIEFERKLKSSTEERKLTYLVLFHEIRTGLPQ